MSKVNFLDGQIFDWYKPHEAVSISDWEPSLTRQEFAADADINEIMRRFEKGEAPSFTPRVPLYLDLTELPETLQETLNMLNDATASFNSLPAQVRREFDNDPVAFVDFASNPDNIDKLRAWGLAQPAPVEPAPQRVEIVGGLQPGVQSGAAGASPPAPQVPGKAAGGG